MVFDYIATVFMRNTILNSIYEEKCLCQVEREVLTLMKFVWKQFWIFFKVIWNIKLDLSLREGLVTVSQVTSLIDVKDKFCY